MAFEKRGRAGTRYLYLSRRDPETGKVKKLYIGRGERADAAANALTQRRNLREGDCRAVQAHMELVRSADNVTATFDAAVVVIMEASLLAEGCHRANYGPWRKSRYGHGRHTAATR